MAFESNDFQVAKKIRLPKSEFNVNCNIPIEEEISKIFTITSDVLIKDKEILDGMINYSGVVETCVIYLTENNEIGSTHASCPFTSKFEDANISVDDKALIRARILDYSIGDIANKNLPIDFVIEQFGFIVKNEDVKSVATSGEDIATKEEEIRVVHLLGECKQRIETESPLQVRDRIKKLLLCESQASIKDVETGMNYVSVSGEVVSRLLYLTENDKFESAYVYDSFKEEIEFDGVTKNTQVEVCPFVIYPEVKASVDNKDKGADILVKVPVELNLLAYDEVEVKVVSDIYSTKNEVEVLTDSFEMTKNFPFEIVEEKIDGNLVLEDDKPRIDKVLFSGGNSVNLTNVFIENGNINIEGIAKTTVVYLNDELGSLNSAEIEIPFSIDDKTNFEDGDEITAYATISDVDVSVKKGRELNYEGRVKVVLYAVRQEISAVISNVNIKEELPEKDYAMEIVFGKENQSLWDIAKANKVSEKMLAEQNADIVFPLNQNTQLVLFYQSNKI